MGLVPRGTGPMLKRVQCPFEEALNLKIRFSVFIKPFSGDSVSATLTFFKHYNCILITQDTLLIPVILTIFIFKFY
jgi:hypothetical protein